MFKLVVLSALLAVAVAKPGLYSAVNYGLPSAVSHQSRVDYHSSPLVVAQAAPLAYASYGSYGWPAAHSTVWPAAVSHTARYDVHRKSALVAALPAYGYGLGYGYAAHGLHAW